MLSTYIRGDFPALGFYRSYLNTALVGLMPATVRDELVRGVIEYISDPHGKLRDARLQYAYLKRELTRLLQSRRPDNITLEMSTTSCIVKAVASLVLHIYKTRRERARVALTVHEYPGVVQAVRSLCESLGYACSSLEFIGREGVPEWEEDAERFIDEGGHIVVASSVEWVTGYRARIGKVGSKARRDGAWLVVDGAQQVGQLPLDPEASGVDFLCSTTRKWLLDPLGSLGVVHVSDRVLREDVRPYVFNLKNSLYSERDYCSPEGRLLGSLALKEDADRFMMINTPPPMSVNSAFHVASYLNSISLEAVQDHILGLRKVAEDMLEDAGFSYALQDYSFDSKSGILLVRTGMKPAREYELCKELERRGVAVSCRGQAGFHGIRISFHIYNNSDDIQVFVEELKRLSGGRG
ncbi:MAG: aminotransferase class V-fold PLP-dependent enzyme [Desulfurococcales archaeon]|nr:aminotransferase class V-fold PLP-dependent enzyme [Desulfurococcales archaeon]